MPNSRNLIFIPNFQTVCKRHNSSVAAVSRGYLTIGRKKLADSQFSDEVVKKNGFILTKPKEWVSEI
ncbi:MAG: hypothetical protein V1773_07865 [bacterium]